ncbi:MAG: hypothetical protein R3E12_14425 [Candidatus Eisenbacteria bacterium]
MSEPPTIPDVWIRQITEEVVRRLGASGAPSASGGSPGPSAGGYDAPESAVAAPGSSPARLRSNTGIEAGACCSPIACGCKLPGFENGSNPDRLALFKEYGVARVGCHPGIGPVDAELASMLDHTLLSNRKRPSSRSRPSAKAHCHGFATVCVQPIWVPLAARILEDSPVKVCTGSRISPRRESDRSRL